MNGFFYNKYSQSRHIHSPRLPPFIGIGSAALNLSSTNKWFKDDRIGNIYAAMHSFVIKTPQVLLPLPRTAVLGVATCLHAALGTFASILLDVAQTKALSRLLLWIPRIQTARSGSLSVGQYLATPSFQDVLALPSLRRMIATPGRHAVLLLSQPHITPMKTSDISSILPRYAGLGFATVLGALANK